MADQGQREGIELGSRPDHALSIKTSAGTEVTIGDPWVARIIATAAAVSGITIPSGLTAFFLRNPKSVEKAAELAVKAWGQFLGVTQGSVVVALNCGTKENFLKFWNDFKEGKVKKAMEREFNKIGFNTELDLTLDEEAYKVIKMCKEQVITREEIVLEKGNPYVSHGQKRLGEERVQKVEIAEDQTQGDSKKRKKEENQRVKKKVKSTYLESGAAVAPTSGLMSKDKQGVLSDDDLETLSRNIGLKWRVLGRRLGFEDEELDAIDERHKDLLQKGYVMLKLWKQREGSAYKETLYAALVHKNVQRKDLAQKYCSE